MPVTIITDNEREFLRGEKDVKDPKQYRRTLRYRMRQRAERYPSDLMLLQENGHEDIVALFYGQIVQDVRIRSDLRELQQSIDTLVQLLATTHPDLDPEELEIDEELPDETDDAEEDGSEDGDDNSSPPE